ncbi:hypothetical protein Vadar_025916 [Vaccinium darrowii]|uniref:Uncharacterized protein n=1 Tax=Vaccinium darrowii TaxID=229202 RepID=A0ACB7YYL8_9ERIC|nr:hypothetical protein Vadar_025916 [Vaccinium darrowii]
MLHLNRDEKHQLESQVMMQLFIQRKTTLMFVIRDRTRAMVATARCEEISNEKLLRLLLRMGIHSSRVSFAKLPIAVEFQKPSDPQEMTNSVDDLDELQKQPKALNADLTVAAMVVGLLGVLGCCCGIFWMSFGGAFGEEGHGGDGGSQVYGLRLHDLRVRRWRLVLGVRQLAWWIVVVVCCCCLLGRWWPFWVGGSGSGGGGLFMRRRLLWFEGFRATSFISGLVAHWVCTYFDLVSDWFLANRLVLGLKRL